MFPGLFTYFRSVQAMGGEVAETVDDITPDKKPVLRRCRSKMPAEGSWSPKELVAAVKEAKGKGKAIPKDLALALANTVKGMKGKGKGVKGIDEKPEQSSGWIQPRRLNLDRPEVVDDDDARTPEGNDGKPREDTKGKNKTPEEDSEVPKSNKKNNAKREDHEAPKDKAEEGDPALKVKKKKKKTDEEEEAEGKAAKTKKKKADDEEDEDTAPKRKKKAEEDENTLGKKDKKMQNEEEEEEAPKKKKKKQEDEPKKKKKAKDDKENDGLKKKAGDEEEDEPALAPQKKTSEEENGNEASVQVVDDEEAEEEAAAGDNENDDKTNEWLLTEKEKKEMAIERGIRARVEKMDEAETARRVKKTRKDPMLKEYLKDEIGLTKDEIKDFEFGDEDPIEEIISFDFWLATKDGQTKDNNALKTAPTLDYSGKDGERFLAIKDGTTSVKSNQAGELKGALSNSKQLKIEDCKAVLRWPRVCPFKPRGKQLDTSIQRTVDQCWYGQECNADKKQKTEEGKTNESSTGILPFTFFVILYVVFTRCYPLGAVKHLASFGLALKLFKHIFNLYLSLMFFH